MGTDGHGLPDAEPGRTNRFRSEVRSSVDLRPLPAGNHCSESAFRRSHHRARQYERRYDRATVARLAVGSKALHRSDPRHRKGQASSGKYRILQARFDRGRPDGNGQSTSRVEGARRSYERATDARCGAVRKAIVSRYRETPQCLLISIVGDSTWPFSPLSGYLKEMREIYKVCPNPCQAPLRQINLLTDHPKLITSELPTNRKLTGRVATALPRSQICC